MQQRTSKNNSRQGFAIILVTVMLSALATIAWIGWREASRLCAISQIASRYIWRADIAHVCACIAAHEIMENYSYYANSGAKGDSQYDLSEIYNALSLEGGAFWPYEDESLVVRAIIRVQKEAIVVRVNVIVGDAICACAQKIIINHNHK